MRLRHKDNGVVINVSDEKGETLLGGAWERADAPKRRTGQRVKSAEDSDD
jgi:hypothetical protein